MTMKLKRVFILLAILPLLVYCKGGTGTVEVPGPPVIEQPENPSGSEGQGNNTSTTPAGEWEKNRGKVVTPSGTGWTSQTVREGITYYAFSGKDPVTGVRQNVCAVDVDLSVDKYAVKITHSNPTAVTSSVHSTYNSIATINAGYEAGSIYIRIDGKDKSSLPNTEIGSTGVRNWKSEAAFFGDGERGIQIKTAETLIRPYMSPAADKMASYIKSQRNFYLKSTEKYILSSSPMLIDDFNPVGETFVDYTLSGWSSLNSEEPQYHQRKRHPRTAVALTENGHFIMMVVDGRQSNFAEGMSAKELTQFFVQNFNPQYALNMDGGGSTAMCVEGLGNPVTHVVDVPINDNKKGNERARDTHFIIVEK